MSNIVTGAGQILATENPWKILKNNFYFILTNWICYWQIRFCTYYAFSLKQMSDIREVLAIKRWFPFNFAKTLQGRHFVVGGPKNFLQAFFLEHPSKHCIAEFTIFVCLLLSWSRRYSTSTARNFNNNWPIYLNFSYMINLCPNIWFIKNSKCQQFVFWKSGLEKT